MSKRIRELALTVPRIKDFYEVGPVQRASVEEFVELIIRECGILADQYNFEKNNGTINPCKVTAYEFITEHFGVEE